MDFKSYIAEAISKVTNIDKKEIKSYVEIPKDETNGDFAFPCFRLAKELKQAPVNIANNIKDNIEIDSNIISKVDVVNGFLNFYIANECLAKETIQKFDAQKEDYGKSNIGEGKTVIVEYSSPNIAKPFHIGHLKTTIIGNSLYKLYKFLGYNTIGINHLGDWINALCEDDEKVLEECRETFKKFEDGDPYCIELWNKFKELSLIEFNKIYDLLGVKFDSYKGEASYANQRQEIVSILEKTGKVTESQGAKIVDLEDVGISTPCIIQKANGASIYATRDLAAIMYRAKTYDYDKCLYVVGEEQSLYLKQVFAVAKYLGLDEKYTNGLEHVSYGMIRLPEGKMSSRKGNFFKVQDLLDEAISKSKEIIQDRDIEDKDLVAKQVGVGAVIFEDLAESRTKNQVFDLKEALNFNGETGPYIQYMTVRTNSVIEKAGYIPSSNSLNLSKITDRSSIKLLKLIDNFENILLDAMHKNEPSIISRYLIDVAQAFSTFYNENKILSEDKEEQDVRIYITYMTKIVLTNGLHLLGIEVPKKM